ncbi:hypothetical protein ANN_07018 [Periplaneta americana]|uniref:DUF4817 domain-containing protein n=1 Tax=Periplaneta americana TaxID=6978 RepID=A0ABQ8THJ5_PERAM|nr:hypothetical protein ANN_07018 [Periplaneta americana]
MECVKWTDRIRNVALLERVVNDAGTVQEGTKNFAQKELPTEKCFGIRNTGARKKERGDEKRNQESGSDREESSVKNKGASVSGNLVCESESVRGGDKRGIEEEINRKKDRDRNKAETNSKERSESATAEDIAEIFDMFKKCGDVIKKTHFDIGCHARIPTRNTILRWVASFRITGSTLKKKSPGRNSIALRLSEATVRSRALRLLSLGPFEGSGKEKNDHSRLCSTTATAAATFATVSNRSITADTISAPVITMTSRCPSVPASVLVRTKPSISDAKLRSNCGIRHKPDYVIHPFPQGHASCT